MSFMHDMALGVFAFLGVWFLLSLLSILLPARVLRALYVTVVLAAVGTIVYLLMRLS